MNLLQLKFASLRFLRIILTYWLLSAIRLLGVFAVKFFHRPYLIVYLRLKPRYRIYSWNTVILYVSLLNSYIMTIFKKKTVKVILEVAKYVISALLGYLAG